MPAKSTKTKSQTKQGTTASQGKSGARAGPMKKPTTGKRTGTAMAKNAGSSSTGGLNLTQADKVLASFQQDHPRLGTKLIQKLQPHGIATGLTPAWR